MKKYSFTAVCTAIIFLGFLGFLPTRVSFSDAYDASCTVSRAGGLVGSGVLLESGYVLTNKHVVDGDASGQVTNDELAGITVKFFSPVASIHTATIVGVSNINWHWGIGGDYAILKIVNPPKSRIHLMDKKRSAEVKPGQLLYCIGATDGATPPHVTFGPRSSDDDYFYGRAGISAYYGNSGGGVFTEDTSELLGLTTKIHIVADSFNPRILPDWLMFTPSYQIREFAQVNNPEVIRSSSTILWRRISWSLIMGGVFGLTLSFFGYNSREEMRRLFRSDAG